MKTLKFRPHLAEMILKGEKTTTWRLFDDKDIQKGDQIALVNWETKEEFARAEVTDAWEKKLGEVNMKDFEGHEVFKDREEMLSEYRRYYGDTVDWNSPLKIIQFKLVAHGGN
jgi:hypothetical protein